jgi:RHS repeat-associated protein
LYSGEQFDSKIGQQYLRARDYDPTTGRFNRLDPFFGNLNDPLSLHKYLYTHADPVNMIDPMGLFGLGGISISISIGSGMRGMVGTAVVGAAKGFLGGAVIGGIVGGTDAALGGEDWLEGAKNGAFWGGIIGAAIGIGAATGGASAFWAWLSHSSQVAIKYAFYAFDFAGTILGIAESVYNGNKAQGIFRAVLGFGIFKLLGKIPTCFVAGTKVATCKDISLPCTDLINSIEFKNIEEIKVDDYVLSREENGTINQWQRVEEVFSRTAYHLRVLTVQDKNGKIQTIKTTNEHPFWVVNRGWTNAEHLNIGDQLEGVEQSTLTVTDSLFEEHKQGIDVYNLKISDYHTYYVTESDEHKLILVHNATYNDVLKAVRAGTDTPSGDPAPFEQAIHALINALGPGVKCADIGPTYNSPSHDVQKWFRIEPAEPWVNNNLPHIKWYNGDQSGHVWISFEDYNALMDQNSDLTKMLYKLFDEFGMLD